MTIINNNNFRYPARPSTQSQTAIVFPYDLNTTNRNFNISLTTQKYMRTTAFESPKAINVKTIVLPIPQKINDVQTISWEPVSLTQLGASIAIGLASIAGSAAINASKTLASAGTIISDKLGALGISTQNIKELGSNIATVAGHETSMSINPFLVMLFKQQNFKEYEFSWNLSPNNLQDTNILKEIISILKNQSLPVKSGLGIVFDYPNMIFPLLSCGNYTTNFKPSVIQRISVDWTGAGQPSFLATAGQGNPDPNTYAPSTVSLTIAIKEIELWYQGEVL